ncbi:MAG: starch-binding protein [Ruminococcaceae bacterium]|nr:starch-binding protein [Oscillospiraceae bacterium]
MRNAKRLLSIVLVVLMLFSMSMVATSAYTVPDGYAVAPGDTTEGSIKGETVGIIGDADMNDAVNVRDATLIQKFAADLVELSEVQKLLSDVNFDKNVNVKDATPIQKWVAGLETLEPVNQLIYVPEVETTTTQEEPSIPTTSVEIITTTDTEVIEPSSSEAITSGDEVEPTSTTATEVTEPTSTTAEDVTEPTSTTAEDVTDPTTTTEAPIPATYTIYFSNNKGWEDVYIYGFYGVPGQDDTNVPWPSKYPGEKMTFVEVNGYGQDVYSAVVPADIDYIKFSDGTATNNRTDNIPNAEFENNTGFYLEDKGSKYWPYATYEYVPSTPVDPTTAEATTTEVATTTTEAEVVVPTTSDEVEPTTSTAEVTEPATTTEAPAPTTYTIYFTNNKGWEGAYIYGFYGVAGETSTGEPLGAYPGTKMTFVEVNGYGQDIYSAVVPADIDYIKFSDGTATNNRTDNIPNAEFENNTGFYLEDKGSKYWPYATYEYVPATPVDPTTAEATTTEVATTTTEAEVVVPTTSDEVEPTTTTAEVVTELTTTTEAPAPTTYTIYFTNNKGWEGAYIYGFYGVAGETSTGEPLGAYPGTKMTFVEVNGYGQDIYSAVVPADIDYIKFSDGTATNNRTDNIPNAEFENNTGFYLEDKGSKYWPYGTYEYVPATPVDPTTTAEATTTEVATTTTEAEVVVPTTSDEVEPTTTTAEAVTEPTTTTEAPAPTTYTIYFTNNKGWEGAYIYGFYGVAGETSTGEPLGAYPGTKMTFVEVNGYGQDVYSAVVPADIDYIKFSDGTATNNRTDNIPNAEFENNTGVYLEDKGSKYWPYGTYEYVPATPVDPTTAEATTTVAVTTTEAPVTTTTEAEVVEPTTTTTAVVEPTTTTAEAVTEPTTTTEAPAPATYTIYFTNNKGWEGAYIYGFYGVAGETSTGEPLGIYPGTKMTFVEVNGYGQDVYSAVVPADIDYIKFSDGTATNNRTDNIPNAEFENNTGFYLEDKGSKYWPYATYEYVPSTPVDPTTTAEATTTVAVTTTEAPVTTTTAAEVVVPTTTTEAEVVEPTTTTTAVVEPTTTTAEAVTEPTTTTEAPAPATYTIYFTNNKGWEGAYIYGFYGVAGETSTGEPLGAYPGTKMTFVEVNGYGQDVYSAVVPADIDYIKFSDGTATNNRTDNIPNAEFENNTGFYLEDKGSKYWPYATYEYVPSTPVDPTTAEATTTVAVTTTEAPVTTTTVAEVVVPTTTTEAEPETPAITVYFVNSGKWSKVNAYAWSPEAAAWPGAAMTKTSEKAPNGADVYSMTYTQTYSNIIFNNGSSQTSDLTFQAGQYYDYATGKWYAKLSDISAEAPTGYTIYCVNSNNWSKINAYVWNPGDAGWPGTAMTKTGEKAANGSDIYSITFAQNHGSVIFNNGSSQTADLTFQAGQYFDLATGKWYASAADVK